MVGFAMRRKLLQFQSFLAQHALREAPKPRPQALHSHFLRSPPATASPSSSSSVQILWSRIAAATAAGGLQRSDAALLEAPKPSPQYQTLHSPSATASPSSSSSVQTLRSRIAAATAAGGLPRSAEAVAAAAQTAASRWLAAARGQGSLDLFSLQRGRSGWSGWPSAASAFAQIPPWAQWMWSADGMVWMLIGANVSVFMLWRVVDPFFMKKHFMVSLDNLKSGRLHTLLTKAFSHITTEHLVTNMIGLYFFGASTASVFGPAFLLKLYVAGAISGSTFFLLENAFLAPRRKSSMGRERDYSTFPALGASGAINAIILLEILLYPKRLLYLYFFIPLPSALVGLGLIGADLYRVRKGGGRVSGSSHLGGALVGALVWAGMSNGWI